jgi:hypothetical protein
VRTVAGLAARQTEGERHAIEVDLGSKNSSVVLSRQIRDTGGRCFLRAVGQRSAIARKAAAARSQSEITHFWYAAWVGFRHALALVAIDGNDLKEAKRDHYNRRPIPKKWRKWRLALNNWYVTTLSPGRQPSN